MLRYAAIFFVIAIIAAIFGFGGIAASAAAVAKILFFIFIVLCVLALVFGSTMMKGRDWKQSLFSVNSVVRSNTEKFHHRVHGGLHRGHRGLVSSFPSIKQEQHEPDIKINPGDCVYGYGLSRGGWETCTTSSDNHSRPTGSVLHLGWGLLGVGQSLTGLHFSGRPLGAT